MVQFLFVSMAFRAISNNMKKKLRMEEKKKKKILMKINTFTTLDS